MVFLVAVLILVLVNLHEPVGSEDDGSATTDAEEATAQ